MYKAEDAHTQPNNLEVPAKFTGTEMLYLATILIHLMHLSCIKFTTCITYSICLLLLQHNDIAGDISFDIVQKVKSTY